MNHYHQEPKTKSLKPLRYSASKWESACWVKGAASLRKDPYLQLWGFKIHLPRLPTNIHHPPCRRVHVINIGGLSFALVYRFTTWGLKISQYFLSIWAIQLSETKKEFLQKRGLWVIMTGITIYSEENGGPMKWRDLPKVPLLFLGKESPS